MTAIAIDSLDLAALRIAAPGAGDQDQQCQKFTHKTISAAPGGARHQPCALADFHTFFLVK